MQTNELERQYAMKRLQSQQGVMIDSFPSVIIE